MKRLKSFPTVIMSITVIIQLVITKVMRRQEIFVEHEVEDELEMTPETILNSKVEQAIENLQASYNEDANKMFEQAKQEKASQEI